MFSESQQKSVADSELFPDITAEMDPLAAIRQRLNELLKETGINQAELAKAITKSPGEVSDFRSGKRAVTLVETAQKIAKFFGVSTSYLLQEARGETPLDANTALLLARYHRMSDEDKRLYLDFALLVLDRAQRDVPPDEGPSAAGPPVSLRRPAGGGSHRKRKRLRDK